ncbi:MAG: 3-methyl-2-oxobutanoate dehydrogenase subunit VorB [Peptoniphilaceae bacterium]|nr:3-methyl-2-oxobutanoate dehydrogenase subunit VorB [Peptoniphilaceae bacterium]
MERAFMKGNEVIAEAAIRAGVKFFAGYPITPQNEIPEYMSWRLREVGGTFVQGESEVASINMVYGASACGNRAMTTTSGPGISLMSEGISYLAGAGLPALIVNVGRGGPGLGSIEPSQSDYLQACKATGHGGFHLMVFAPDSLQETVNIIYNAFDYAERDRQPVFLLMDGVLGSMMEMVELPPMKEFHKEGSEDWRLGNDVPGKHGARIVTSIYPEAGLETKNMAAGEMWKRWQEEDVQVETIGLEDAEYVLVAYGIAARICKEAMQRLREKGYRVGLVRPITLVPFPEKVLEALNYDQVKAMIDVEMTIPPQMRQDLERITKGCCPIRSYGRSGGIVMDDDTTVEALEAIIREVEDGKTV